MPIERSHGKARPMLPRSSDQTPGAERTDRERCEDRDARGRVQLGNQLAVGRGWKYSIKRTLTRAGATTEEAERVIADTTIVYASIVRDLSYTGPLVRMNAAGAAREFALAGYYDAKALEAGLMTDLGQKLSTKASQHRQRCERMTVTTRDLAKAAAPRRLAQSAAARIRDDVSKGGRDAQ